MDLKFTKSTDTKHKIKLESALVYSEWRLGYAPVGQKVGFTIGACMVGEGCPVEVKGLIKNGPNMGTVKGKMRGNKFTGEFTVPAKAPLGRLAYFEVKLPKVGLKGTSNYVATVPPIKVTDMSWSAKEARRGDIVTLKATTENVPDAAQVKVVIYEYDRDKAHDKIVELPTTIKNKKIELLWAYEYHEDTDEIPTQAQMQKYGKGYNPPEYFFKVEIDGQQFGEKQESGLLTFRDWIEIRLVDNAGEPLADEKYVLTMPDGSEVKGKLDANGYAKVQKVPPGNVIISFPRIQEQDIVGKEGETSEVEA